ncbi:MAG: GntR family transcriptional regulator [Clostridiales bacterium]|nr:GntR family transcriptional regulator [Clostridiales bacterium]
MWNWQDDPGVPIYEQVIRQVKRLIVRGLLKPGDRLPSVRELASQILANPNTVAKAYQELERQGVIVTAVGRGAFVAETPSPPEGIRTALYQRVEDIVWETAFWGIPPQEVEEWVRQASSRIAEERQRSEHERRQNG